MQRQTLFAFLLTVLSLPLYAIDLPDIGASTDTALSPIEEQRLGDSAMRQLRREVEVIDDLEINNYINALGNNLAAVSDMPEQRFTFFVVKSPIINAFAIPGGYIGIHSGLILQTQDEGELASVIGHEIAHVTQRHIARSIETAGKFSLPAMAAMIAGMIVATKNPEIGQAAVATIAAGNIQMQINFTRVHEQEADRVGMQILSAAGFDPRSMPAFFEQLQNSSRYYGTEVPEFLRTHPVTTSRIAESRDRAEQYPKHVVTNNPLYHLMRAKLLVVTDNNPRDLLKKLQKNLTEGRFRDERAVHYALALTLLKSQQIEGIQAHIDWLLKHDTDRVAYHLLQADLALLQNKPAVALQLYEQALTIYPADQLLGIRFAETLLRQGQAAKAKTILLTLSSTGNNPYYYRLLAQAYQDTGSPAEAGLTLAENLYLQGKTQLALAQLKQVSRLPDLSPYLNARITERYSELETEFEAEKEAEKEAH
ncbi:M48 family metalloprotease [Beggiatoa leptomitoformis]|uniref:Putative beta-barrel assembly-enhancing protease n=1 Tax=Beggiatoa leptomitoformis TaxID=288004 RepID=A0A2N9YHG0_9GAMM|nr:M48 family metalloprotease [Beggiatoa leptomitoformis]ALG68053.1 M48 family metalloprotease [Beggiatoa leptomitoformis]AUI69656.1 M48 family metalloprotease [Beggiatoa leptomitoformis]